MGSSPINCRQDITWDCWDETHNDPCGGVGQYRCSFPEGAGPAWLIDGYPAEHDHEINFIFEVTSPMCDCRSSMCRKTELPSGWESSSCPHDCPNFTFSIGGGCGPFPPADTSNTPLPAYPADYAAWGTTRICYPDNPCTGPYVATDTWSAKPGDQPTTVVNSCPPKTPMPAGYPHPRDLIDPWNDGGDWPNGYQAMLDDCYPWDTFVGHLPYHGNGVDFPPVIDWKPPIEDSLYLSPECPGSFGAMNDIIDGYVSNLWFNLSSTDGASSTTPLSETNVEEEVKCQWKCVEEDDVTYFELLNSACNCGSDYISGPCTPGEIIRTDCA